MASVPVPANLSALSDANRTYHVAQSSMELLPNYYRWTYGAFLPHLVGDVVELGCGAGLGIGTYVHAARSVTAVDHDPELLRRIAATHPQVRTVAADLTGDWDELADVEADAVVLMDVLEHFADDADFLSHAARLLRPGGVLAIKVPAQARLYSPMDQASGHYRRYDPADIGRLAAAIGFRVAHLRPINRVGAIAYRAKNKGETNFSRSFAPWQLKAINVALPLVRVADLLPLGPGLSLAAVLAR